MASFAIFDRHFPVRPEALSRAIRLFEFRGLRRLQAFAIAAGFTGPKAIQATLDTHPFVDGKGAFVQTNRVADGAGCFVRFSSKTNKASSRTSSTMACFPSNEPEYREPILVREVRHLPGADGGAELLDGGLDLFVRGLLDRGEVHGHAGRNSGAGSS